MRPIIVFAIEGALGSSLALPLEMLHAALQHRRARERRFALPEIRVVAEHRGALSMSGSLRLLPDMLAARVQEAELAIIPSLWRTPQLTVSRHPGITACIRRLAASGTRICAVGTGSYIPAAAGLLDGRAATTHWSFFGDFARRYPAVQLQRRHLITRSGNFYCAGSVNSVADLMVHFIRELFGADAARQVEAQFSPEIRRPFEAHSFVEGEAGAHPDEAVWIAQDWMLAHLGEALRMPELAARCGISTRSLNRRFRAALGTTPLAFLQEARTAAARELLRASNTGIAEIAARCGFGSASHFSRSFTAHAGVSPQDYRRRVRGKLFSAA
jgi:transcriptional regulator GlxA family with amidase domain